MDNHTDTWWYDIIPLTLLPGQFHLHPTCSLDPRPDITNTHSGLGAVASGGSVSDTRLVTWSSVAVSPSSRRGGGLVLFSVHLTFDPCELGVRVSPLSRVLGLVAMALCGTGGGGGGVKVIIEVWPCLELGQCYKRVTLLKYSSLLK